VSDRGRALLEVLGASTRLGLTSFGGPIAHLGYFHDEFVVRRRWLDEKTYVDLVALSQFLPGPASTKVGIAIGLSRAGYLGAFAAWAGFTLPSALLLGVTLHIGTDIAAVPFLWVLPLALYLLTFVLVFARRPLFPQRWMLLPQIVFVGLIAFQYQTPSLYALLGIHIGAMFFTAMVCHGQLTRLNATQSQCGAVLVLGERGEDFPAHPKVGLPEVRTFNCLGEA
jgi:chromate transporter